MVKDHHQSQFWQKVWLIWTPGSQPHGTLILIIIKKTKKQTKNKNKKKTKKTKLLNHHCFSTKINNASRKSWKSMSSSSNASYWDAKSQPISQSITRKVFMQSFEVLIISSQVIFELKKRNNQGFYKKIRINMPKSHFLSFFAWKSINQSITICMIG